MNRKLFFAISSGRSLGAHGLMAALLLCGAMLVAPATSSGTTMYTYTGNFLGPDADCGCSFAPYTTSDSVMGFFTVNAPLADNLTNMTNVTGLVTDFSFSDGLQTFNESSSLMFEAFEVATNSSGAIDAWEVELGTGYGNVILSCNGDLSGTDACSPGNGWGVGGAADETFYSGSVGLNEGAPGTWTAAPEPSILVLLGTELLGLLAWAARSKRHAPSASC